MSKFSNRLKELRNSRDLSQQKLADKLKLTKSSINMYERGEREPGLETIESIADFFNVDLDYLLGKSDIPNKLLINELNRETPNLYMNNNIGIKIPVLGRVVAGIPLEAVEDIIDYEEIPREMAECGEYFALKIRGDSMEPKFSDGDVVIVRKQSYADNGDIAIVLVNGDEATIKKIKKQNDGISLIPSNPKYDIMFFTNSEIESKPVNIIGKVVELRAKF